jgi:homoserine/homoserine lactone efflux protein
MDVHVWWAFFAASWLISLSPGSAAVLSLGQGLAYGVRPASVTIGGMGLGLALVLLVAGAGVGALLLASSVAFTVVKALGAAYLIWLGWRQWTAPVDAGSAALDLPAAQAPVSARAVPSARERFMTGFLTNATNPKGIVFMVAVLPQFIDPHRPLWTQLAILMVTSVGVEVLVMHGYAFLASRAQRWLSSAKARRQQNRVFGGVLMAMGAALMMVKRVAG